MWRLPAAASMKTWVITVAIFVVAIIVWLLLGHLAGPGDVSVPAATSAVAHDGNATPNLAPLPTPDLVRQAWKTYTSTQFGFSFMYPPGLAASNGQNPFISPENRVSFDFPQSYTLSSTTGLSASISFAVSRSTSNCWQSDTGGQHQRTPQPIPNTLHGLAFDTLEFGACGAGDCDDVYQYSLVRNNLCYRADLTIFSTPVWGSVSPEELDQATQIVTDDVKAIFQQILSTLTFAS